MPNLKYYGYDVLTLVVSFKKTKIDNMVTQKICKELKIYNYYRSVEAAGTHDVVQAGQGDATGWEEMMDEEHEKS